jgi:hypothetical protein
LNCDPSEAPSTIANLEAVTANPASETINRFSPGWMVEIVGGNAIPLGAYSMIEVDELTCALERPGGPSLTMPAADIVEYERMGFFRVVSAQEAVNDNGDDPRRGLRDDAVTVTC